MANTSEQKAPLVNAQQREAAKWQYKIVEESGSTTVEKVLNELAADGWEVMTHNASRTESNTGSQLHAAIRSRTHHTVLLRRYETPEVMFRAGSSPNPLDL